MTKEQAEALAARRLASTGREQVILYDMEASKFRVYDKKKKMPERFVVNFPRKVALMMREQTLTGSETWVLFELLAQLVQGDTVMLLQTSYTGVAEEMGMARPNFSRALKGLRDRGFLLQGEPGMEYINPALFYRGSAKDIAGKDRELYEKGAKVLDYLEEVTE